MNVEIERTEVLSDEKYFLRKYILRQQGKEGEWETHEREVYDRGNGAAVLLYNNNENSVILTRQFRLPAFLNGTADGMLIEVCAGLLDGQRPEDAIVRETEEETGYKIKNLRKLFSVYMSPGGLTEMLHLYIGEYDASAKRGPGGGVDQGEKIEVLKVSFDTAWNMIFDGRIRDAKTIMLLQQAKLLGVCQS